MYAQTNALFHGKRAPWRVLAIPLRIMLTFSLVLTPLVLTPLVLTPLVPIPASAAANQPVLNQPVLNQSDGSTKFTIRIENISGESKLPSPFAPGVWAVHDGGTNPLFDENAPDRGLGLAAIAEDGNPAELAGNLAGAAGIASSGVFNTPAGSDGPGPIFPDGAYEFEVTGNPGDYVSFASMYVQTNDVFTSPGENGIALFDENGNPIEGDITKHAPLWDVGSEVNEAPGMGPNQAPRQAGADMGPAEGGVTAFTNGTRALPLASAIVDVHVSESGGTYKIDVTNISATSGAIDTPIAPLFYATHNDQWSLFTNGEAASAGLEMQAEDGSPAGLVGEHTGAAGTGMVGAAGSGPAITGDGYSFEVTPTAAYPYLTFSGMVVQTNDAFFSPSAKGIALLHSDGTHRSAEDVQADIDRMLAVWDAGTEANEVPGVGLHQAPRQAGPNTGDADPIPGVRLYNDATNDLAGENAGGFINIDIAPLSQADTFLVTIKNTSDETVYPGILTPAVWATHNANIGFFNTGAAASAGLEALAEDGNGGPLADALAGAADVAYSGLVNLPISGDQNSGNEGGPLFPGDYYRFAVKASADAPYFSFAQMIVPSNDAFAAFGPAGIRLYNEDGTRRSHADLSAEIAGAQLAWDAGTEQNQAGAAGPDQAPRQAGPNTGAIEGPDTVRLTTADPVWDYPTAEEVVRITITPSDDGSGGPVGGGDPMQTPTTFRVRLTNISGDSDLPGPFAPGVFAIHNASDPLFTVGQPDRGDGLAPLAEDGNAGGLGAVLEGQEGVAASGVFNTPIAVDGTRAEGPGPIFPGGSYEFEFTTTEDATRLSLATMLVQTNDVFAAPGSMGFELFDADGNPKSGDITDYITLWDVGSERNEAPGLGPNQAPRQSGPNTGFGEGGVTPFDNSTRSLPLAGGIVDVMVTEAGGTYTVNVTNISATSGSGASRALDTPIAPLFYATHNSDWSLFTTGENASAGLEMQAEDGSPAGLVGEHTGAAGTGMVGAAGDGPVLTGGGYSFDVTPTAAYPYLTFSGMVVQTNDVFFAPSPMGIALLHSDGSPRSSADVEADIDRMLANWDAGTEANEVPGVGPNQAPRQAGGNTGAADPIPGVRIYNDTTNDLAGSQAGGFADMTITHGADPMSFVVTVRNTSDSTVYPGALTPVAWALHNSDISLFTVGETASPGLETLAEDGDPSVLAGELTGATGIGTAGVQAIPTGATDPGPILPGGEYQFTVTVDPAYPYLSTANMIVPSNDTFLAFGPMGIALLDENGDRRSESDIAADIAADLIAWDAGTERNQGGAGGPDQAPRQAGPNTGANEGDAVVIELIGTDGVWNYPALNEVLQVTLEVVDGTDSGAGDERVLYISSDHAGTIAGIDYKPADILGYYLDNGGWSMILDGSDLGIQTNNLRAFDWMADGSLLMSFAYPMWIEGLGWVDDSDIVKFMPTSLGETASGSFEWYFDGSDVGLNYQGEDIDGLNIAANGDLILSTLGGYRVDGARGRDEDLIRFTPTSLGDDTDGTWAIEFDGSDVDLTRGSEDIRGSYDDGSGHIYLTSRRDFSAEGDSGSKLVGDSDDIFVCDPVSLGHDTDCTFSLFWDGDEHGMSNQLLGAFTFGPAVALSDGQSVNAAGVAGPTGEMIELVGDEMAVEAAADVEADDMDAVEELDQQLLLPFVTN